MAKDGVTSGKLMRMTLNYFKKYRKKKQRKQKDRGKLML